MRAKTLTNKRIVMSLVGIAAMILVACQPDTPTATTQPTQTPTQAVIEATSPPTENTPEGGSTLNVNGYEIKVDSASLSKEYYSAGYALTAVSGENLLILKINVLPRSDDTEDILSWAVTLDTDDNNGIKPAGSELQSYDDTETDVVTWVFPVPETTTTFVLNLPDSNLINISSVVSPLP
jgi:hypothetical protein